MGYNQFSSGMDVERALTVNYYEYELGVPLVSALDALMDIDRLANTIPGLRDQAVS